MQGDGPILTASSEAVLLAFEACVCLQGDATEGKEVTNPTGKVCLAGSTAAAAACVRCCRP